MDSSGGVVSQGEQDGVPHGAGAGYAGFSEQRLDLVSGEVPKIAGWALLLADRKDLGDLVEPVGLADGAVAAKRLDHRETLVASSGRAAPLGFQPVEEPKDPGAVDVGQAEPLGWDVLCVFEPNEQQLHRVPVSGDGSF